jgi:hypothetical protein
MDLSIFLFPHQILHKSLPLWPWVLSELGFKHQRAQGQLLQPRHQCSTAVLWGCRLVRFLPSLTQSLLAVGKATLGSSANETWR